MFCLFFGTCAKKDPHHQKKDRKSGNDGIVITYINTARTSKEKIGGCSAMSSYKRNLGGYSDDDISRFLASFQQNYDDSVGRAAPTLPSKRPKLKPEPPQPCDREVISTIPAPPPTMTGVSESTTRICAKLSQQIYKANSIHDFTNLSTDGHDVQVLKFDNHGILLGRNTFVCRCRHSFSYHASVGVERQCHENGLDSGFSSGACAVFAMVPGGTKSTSPCGLHRTCGIRFCSP